MAERQGPEGGSDDLFEDLDKFFSSIDEEDWPEPIEPGAAPAPPAAPEAMDSEAEPPPEPAEEAPRPDPEEAPLPPEPAPSTPSAAGGREDMSSEDVSRLRDVLSDDETGEEEVEIAFPEPPEVATEEELFGYAGARADEGGEAEAMSGTWETGGGPGAEDVAPDAPEEPGDLTVDDLRKPPPQYRDLPGPREDEAPPPSGSRFGPDEPDLGAEPSLADVEAAADRVAGEFATPTPQEPSGYGGGADPGSASQGSGYLGSGYQGSIAEGGTGYGGDTSWLPGELSEEADEVSGAREVPGAIEDDLLADLAEPRGPRKVKVGEPEALLGPAWEDPTARNVGSDPRGPRISGRNIPVAVASALILAVVALVALAWKASAFSVVAGGVVLIAQWELYTTTQRRGYHPATVLGLILGALVLAGAYLKGEPAMAFIVVLGVVLSFLWYMSAPPKARSGSLANIGVTVLGLLYVPFLASFALLILTEAASGRALMLAVIGLTFLYDVSAFFVGSFYGSRPLAPTISPKKSWEGLAAATLLTFAISLAFVSRLGPMDVPKALGLALVIVVFAPIGDLAESAIKRDLGVKDMGSIMPGHGGALDRIDSVLFVAPAAFYFLRLVF